MTWSVLVADDEEAVLTMVTTLIGLEERLTVAGRAHDGAEAVELARQACPGAIICDLQMPRLSGFEAIPQLRELCPSAPIVVYSAHPAADEVLRLGADAVFDKAGNPIDLVQVVVELCQAGGHGTAA